MDWNKVEQLLNVVDKAKDHPKLAAVTQTALAELDTHAVEAAKAVAEANAKKAADEAAAARARAEVAKKAESQSKTPAQLQAEAEAARADSMVRRPLGENPNVTA